MINPRERADTSKFHSSKIHILVNIVTPSNPLKESLERFSRAPIFSPSSQRFFSQIPLEDLEKTSPVPNLRQGSVSLPSKPLSNQHQTTSVPFFSLTNVACGQPHNLPSNFSKVPFTFFFFFLFVANPHDILLKSCLDLGQASSRALTRSSPRHMTHLSRVNPYVTGTSSPIVSLFTHVSTERFDGGFLFPRDLAAVHASRPLAVLRGKLDVDVDVGGEVRRGRVHWSLRLERDSWRSTDLPQYELHISLLPSTLDYPPPPQQQQQLLGHYFHEPPRLATTALPSTRRLSRPLLVFFH